MSHTSEDLYVDYLLERDSVAEDWAQMEREIVESFTLERLKSYYLAHPDVAQKALGSLVESKDLLSDGHPTAALVFAGIAAEVAYKTALLRPMVSGLVHNETMAAVVMDLATSHTGLERFSSLLSAILVEFADVDLKTFTRKGSAQALWAEMKKVAEQRNAVVHGGEEFDPGAARVAIALAAHARIRHCVASVSFFRRAKAAYSSSVWLL